jgi:hypothetical protein
MTYSFPNRFRFLLTVNSHRIERLLVPVFAYSLYTYQIENYDQSRTCYRWRYIGDRTSVENNSRVESCQESSESTFASTCTICSFSSRNIIDCSIDSVFVSAGISITQLDFAQSDMLHLECVPE